MLMKCSRLHHVLVDSKVSKLGLHRGTHSMLLTIYLNDNISQKELSKKMEISAAAVTATLKKLEYQGFIKRYQNDDDIRINYITVTAKGVRAIEKTQMIFDEVDCQTFNSFSEEELTQLIGYLSRISDNLKKVTGSNSTN